MKWFKKHLNWTLLLGVLTIDTPILTYICASYYLELIWLFLIPTVVVELALKTWYLHQKSRNYAWLLATFIKPFYIPVGFIILLCLSNKRTEQPLPQDKVIL